MRSVVSAPTIVRLDFLHGAGVLIHRRRRVESCLIGGFTVAMSRPNWFFAVILFLAASGSVWATAKLSYISPQITPVMPGGTSSVVVELKNPNSGGKTLSLSTGVPGHSGIKTRFRVWVPPESSLRWFFPIMLPPAKHHRLTSIPISASLSGTRQGTQSSQFIQHQRMQTAVIEGNRSSGVIDLAIAMRRQIGLPKVMTYISVMNFPVTAPTLLGIKRIFVGTGNSWLSGAQVDALRDWIIAGGRVWIDLAKASNRQLARTLLGGNYDLAYVETIRSASYPYRIHGHPRIIKTSRSRKLRCYFPGNSHVVVSAGGWPLVMRYSLGRGQVWLDAVDRRALLTPQGRAIPELWPATREFFAAKSVSQVPRYALRMAANAIGYRVISRRSVMLIFGLLIGFVAVGGWILSRRGKGGMLGVFALAVALIASGTLYVLGRLERGPVPESESAVQVATVLSNDCMISGEAAIFTPRQMTVSARISAPTYTYWNRFINSQRDCRFDYSPDQSSTNVRNLTIPSGKVVNVLYETFQHTAQPDLLVHAAVNQDGFSGNFESKYPIEHAVIAGPSGVMALQLGSANAGRSSFTSGTDQILPAGQYMSGVLLSRSDQRQEKLTAALLAANPAHRPELLAWSDDIPPAWNVTKTKLHLCNTLMVLPFTPQLPPTGTAIAVPWPMVRMQIVRGPKGQMSAPVYNFDLHRWMADTTISGPVYMKYSVPRLLRHIKATYAHLEFGITAPGRKVSLALYDRGVWISIATVTAARAVFNQTFELKPGEFRNGHLLLRLNVGFSKQPNSSWHFAYGRVSIHGLAE